MRRLVPVMALLAACVPRHRDRMMAADPDSRVEEARRDTWAPDERLRERGAIRLGQTLRADAIDPLLDLARDMSPRVRAAAAFSLGQFGWRPDFAAGREREIAAALKPLLAAPDAGSRAAAVEAIAKVAGDDAPALVAPLLKDPDASVRAEAALALFRWRIVKRVRNPEAPAPPELAKEPFDVLVSLASDKDDAVRRAVAYYFVRVKDARGAQTAMELSTDRDRWVRFFAVLALGRCGDEKGSQAAVAATGDKEHLVRLAAVQSLVALKKPELVPAGLAKDASHHVRAAAAEAIGAGTAPVEPLRALREDASVTVRCAALQAHAKRQKGFAAEAILKAMEDANWVVREAAVGACAELGTNAEAFLEKALADKDERVRAAAIEAIGGIETKTAFETLRKALGADSLAERGTAVEALSKRKEPERIAAAWACFEACTDRKWVEVRESLVGIFARTATPETERHLRVAARDPALSVASKAARALRDRGASDVPFVREPEWRGTPYGGLRFGRNPVAVVETSKGTFEVECLADEAPVHVANFVGLAKAGFYDGLLWHRVVPAFVIQGGDPMGNGWGDAGWSLRAEINRARYGRGALGMPRSEGFDTGGCQLFFTHVPTPHLDGQYTVFGRVVAGEEVIDRIEKGDRIVRVTVRE